LKWPNDVLSDRGKLAGILVELGGEYQGPCAAIIGVGLNVRLTAALHEQAGQPVNDLATLAGRAPDRNRVAAALMAALAEGLEQFEREGFAAFVDEYARHDLLRGKPLRVQGPQATLEGVGAGVDARGALLLQADDGLHRIDSADVTVRRA
jgi:BirA family biotin operon repressor/biotin-[acetyl-CoA-carboxylase] ligase